MPIFKEISERSVWTKRQSKAMRERDVAEKLRGNNDDELSQGSGLLISLDANETTETAEVKTSQKELVLIGEKTEFQQTNVVK